jgi:hypothetical protein
MLVMLFVAAKILTVNVGTSIIIGPNALFVPNCACFVVNFLQTNIIGQSFLDIYGKIKATANFLLSLSNGTARFEKCKQSLD